MKTLLILLFLTISTTLVSGQTNLRTVMVDINGVIQRPTNFISVNNISTNTNIIGFSSAKFIQEIYQSFFAGSSLETTNGSSVITNGAAYLSIDGINTNGMAGIRLIGSINTRGASGTGTAWGDDNHATFANFDGNINHGIFRFVLGIIRFPTTGIGSYPTNRAIGFEMQNVGGTNQVRLIAHNGTTNTNGSWVSIGSVFQRYSLGVVQNKSSGQVFLLVGTNVSPMVTNTNATISGGPTNAAAGELASLDAAIFTTNTNASGANVTIFKSLVEVTD